MDWIKARLNCSPAGAWTILRETLASDIERWREVTNAPPGSPLVAMEDGRMTITVKADEQSIWATVQRKGNRIRVRHHHPAEPKAIAEFELIPQLNEAGECRLRHGQKELEFWQASRLILESLLFSD